ncbi:MAG: adenylate/guanylate cyclase domain-containing protein, partial [Gammaproteobacteria bacterium]|nr:adenylate/guanylate cyclase domain-containing protein [Gammaproteobacteria bacterium]
MQFILNWILIILKNPKIVGFLVSVLVFLFIFALKMTGNLQILELAVYDRNIMFEHHKLEQEPPILLVKIVESDIQELGQWPLSDEMLSKSIKIIAAYAPRAIGVDMYRDIPVQPGHEQLIKTLRSSHNVIAIEKFGNKESNGVPGPPVLQGTEQLGFNDIPSDSGGIVRRGLLFLDDGETSYFSFPLRLALLYLQPDGIFPQAGEPDPYNLRLGDVTIIPFESNDGPYVNADAAGYQFMLDFKGGPEPFHVVTLKQLMDGAVNPEWIKDRIVIIGVDAESVKDHFFTPYSSDLKADTGISGLAMHAHIINQLLRIALQGDQPIKIFTDREELLWILIWCLLGAAVGIWIRSAFYFSVISFSGLFILGAINYFAFASGYWVSLVPPVIGWLTTVSVTTAYITYFERSQKNQLMQIFSKYVSSEVADTIWQRRDLLLDDGRLQSQKLMATVFFTDLQGFTAVSEAWEPEVLMEWLNGYMDQMAILVINHDGVVDDYFGDAIKANFGVPIPRTDYDEIRQDVINAIDCALEMSKTMDRLNTEWQQKGLP